MSATIAPVPKIIWTLWFQGREQAPDVVQRCIASWERLNPGWQVRCLDERTLGRYVDVAQHIDLTRQTVTAASLSDIARMLLLHEYGGVWVDATLLCNRPLDEWLPQAAEGGFFAFANPGPDRLLASWFIAAATGNPLLAKWAARALGYWKGRAASDDYFWLHHQFGDLCVVDAEARAAWGSTPKISALGPHALQRDMYAADAAGRDIDWTLPVFKLVHRIDKEAYRPGTFLFDLLHRHDLPAPAAPPVAGAGVTQVAGLKVKTENLGDHIRIEAGLRLLKRLGVAPETLIDRDDEIANAPGLTGDDGSTGILVNGWFKTNPAEWPPNPKLSPIYLGFHIRLFQSPTLVSEAALAHYSAFAPIGCRDRYTQELLQSRGVDAFLSHCLTTTFPRRIADPAQNTETFIVSRTDAILDYLPPEIRENATFLSQYSGSGDFASNMVQARELLERYRDRARLIVTTMLHCALPAIAMGIPTIVFFPPNEGAQHQSDRERFSSLMDIIRVFQPAEASDVDWRGYTPEVGAIKLALIDRLAALVAERWGHFETPAVGPIAPASALPVPSVADIERYLADPARLRMLAEAASPDRLRWGSAASYKPEWGDRARLAAPLVPDGSHVLEIGVGRGQLREMLEHRCRYVGADLAPLDDRTITLDIEKDPLPDARYDTIIMLGVLTYLHAPRVVVEKITAAADLIVMSYCCVRAATPEAHAARLKRGWVNHMTKAELVELFESCGFSAETIAPYVQTESIDNLVFAFRRVSRSYGQAT